MSSPADGYKTLAGILSVNTMMEKRLASIEKALAGGGPKKVDVKAAAGGGGSDKFMTVLVKTSQDQLKTLLNIEKLLGSDSKKGLKGKNIEGSAIGVLGISAAAAMYKEVGKEDGDKFVSFITDFFKAFDNVDEGKMKSGGEAIEKSSKSLIHLLKALSAMKSLIPAAEVSAKALGGVLKELSTAFSHIDKDAVENAKQAAKALGYMALGMLVVTVALVIMGMALMEYGAEIAMGVLVVAGVAGLFYLIGTQADIIDQGAKAMAFVGLSMIALAAGFYFFALGISEAGKIIGGGAGNFIVGLVAGIGTIILLATIYYFAGEYAKDIVMGAIAFAAIGVSLIFLSFGLEQYFGVVAKIFGMDKGDGGGSIGGALGGVFGGIVTTLGGISLLVLLGGVFALAGMFELGIPMMILWGALAFAAIGVSLLILTPGLEKYFDATSKILGIKTDAGDMGDVSSVFGGIATTIGGIMLLVGLGATFALAGIASPLILLGAAAFAAIGLALTSLADGITYYMDVAGDTDVGENLETNLIKIRNALLSFVGGENKDGGVFGAIKGAISGIATGGQLAVALSSAMLIGPALTSIGQGIGAWANLEQMPRITGYDKMGQPIFDKSATVDANKAMENIVTYLPGIVEPFIELSNRANLGQAPNLLASLTGIQLSESPFSRGVSIAGAIGPVLSSLAQGIGVFADLTQAPRFKGYDKMGQPIFDKSATVNMLDAMPQISEALTLVMDPFIELAARANLGQEASLLSILTGVQLSESPFSRGVQIAGGIGPVLSSLAQGIGIFANLSQAPKITGYDDKGQPIFNKTETVDVLAGIDGITEATTAIIEPFIALSNNAALTKGTSLLSLIIGTDFGESPFQRGVSITGQIGAVLSSLAQGIGVFGNLSQAPKITGYDELGQPIYDKSLTVDLLGSIANITNIIDPYAEGNVLTPMIKLGKYLTASKPFSIGGFLSKLMTGEDIGTSPAEKGLAFALQIGRVLTEIGTGLGIFVNLDNIPLISGYDAEGKAQYSGKTVDSTKAVNNIGTVLTSIITVLSHNSKSLENLEDSEDGAKAIGPLVGSMLNGIASSLEVFSSPDNIKQVIGYDKVTGKAIYSEKGTSIKKVIHNIKYVISEIIYAVAKKSEALDLLEDGEAGANAIGKLLSSLTTPIKKFAELEGELKGKGGMVGLSNHISYVIKKLVGTISMLYNNGSFDSASEGAEMASTISSAISRDILDMVNDIAKAPIAQYNTNIKLVFDSFKMMSQVNKDDKKHRTFMAQFTDEIYRLSAVSSPFSKFVKEFGIFAKEMGVFKENFSLMDTDGIMAFESWTSAVEHLAVTVESAGLSSIVNSVDGLIDNAFGTGGDKGGNTDVVAGKKENIEKENSKDKGKETGKETEAKATSMNTKQLELSINLLQTKIDKLTKAIDSNTVVPGG